jgi:hypothetical protein
MNIMHSKNKENLYWGKNVFPNPVAKFLVSIYDRTDFSGEDIHSPYFWGDICKEKSTYTRLWGTEDINTLKFNPSMPYHDPAKPYVNYWFSFSDGYTARFLNKLLQPDNVRRLVKERGTCIVYTHFAAGFCARNQAKEYELNPTTKMLLENVAKQKDGWFVPVSTILDRLRLIKKISAWSSGKIVFLVNNNDCAVEGVTILVAPEMTCVVDHTSALKANADGELQIGSLKPHGSTTLEFSRPVWVVKSSDQPSLGETFGLIYQRVKIMLFSHKG